VAVPRGTNAARWSPSRQFSAPPTVRAARTPQAPGAGEAALYVAYLKALDAGFEGEYGDWAGTSAGREAVAAAATAAEAADADAAGSAPPSPAEAPVPRSGPGAGEVDATAANAAVAPSGRSTQLGAEGCPTSFLGVEALLSALEGMGVSNARIEVEAGAARSGVVVTHHDDEDESSSLPAALEMPVIDGSALGWAVEVARAGVRPAPPRPDARGPPPPKTIPSVGRPITVRDPAPPASNTGGFLTYIPGLRPELSSGVGAPPDVPVIGRQWFSWAPGGGVHYRWALAPARDWAPSVRALTAAREAAPGKAAYGAGTVNTTLIGAGDRWLEPQRLRFPGDEPARHDACDLIGDLSLLASDGGLGLPRGHVIGWNATPALRLAFVKALAAEVERVEVGEAAREALE
jgi:UDP-3-O-[3-hydroxymyristoyl] N-acetylglucosamine deacetylase